MNPFKPINIRVTPGNLSIISDILQAAEARVNGDFENPKLIEYGELSTSVADDVNRILDSLKITFQP